MALSICRNLANAEFKLYSKGKSCIKYAGYSTVSDVQLDSEKKPRKQRNIPEQMNYRFIYPEFLPDPTVKYRNSVREKFERHDMLNRRKHVDIPEFYVGSILAVKISDPHAQGKINRFVGICVNKVGTGLKSAFTLRNVVDHQGVEIRYHMYDPLIHNIQILRLEKRLDPNLHYLKDADPKYSTFSFDMDPEILPEGAPVPVNCMQIELMPKPWHERWERKNLKGVVGLEKHLSPKNKLWLEKFSTPWEKFDLMKTYRKTIPEEEQSEIWSEVYNQLHQLEITRRKVTQRRVFVTPKKIG